MRNKLILMIIIMSIFYKGIYATDVDIKIGTEQLILGGRAGVEAGIGKKNKERLFLEGGVYIFVPASMGKYLEVKTGIDKESCWKIGVQVREGKDISYWRGAANKSFDGYSGSNENDTIVQAGPVIEYSKKDGLLYIAVSMLRSIKERDEFLNGYLDIGFKIF